MTTNTRIHPRTGLPANHLRTALAVILLLLPCLPTQANNLSKDVQKIQTSHQGQKFLRCVLNKRPRCLAIHLDPQLSVAYDTWQGALCFAWRPDDPEKPLNLTGVVFTGAHGPQPRTTGKLFFDHRGTQYRCSDKNVRLRYKGHRVDPRGHVILQFNFIKPDGSTAAVLEETVTVTRKPRLTLQRSIKLSQLDKDLTIAVDFPKTLQWSATQNHTVTLSKNGTTIHKAQLPR